MIALDRRQGVFKQGFAQFGEPRIARRLAEAKRMLEQYGDVLARIDQRFGVPGGVVVAIWGLETDFGAGIGRRPALRSLATLAQDCRRSGQFQAELMDALRSFSDAQALSRELAGGVPMEEDWLEHADAHTGALFAFCCRAGGRLSGADLALLGALGRYGRHMGRVWHVAEDLSVIDHGVPSLHLVTRARGGRPVLPVVLAAERDPSVGESWKRLATDLKPKHLRSIAHEVELSGLSAVFPELLEGRATGRTVVRIGQ